MYLTAFGYSYFGSAFFSTFGYSFFSTFGLLAFKANFSAANLSANIDVYSGNIPLIVLTKRKICGYYFLNSSAVYIYSLKTKVVMRKKSAIEILSLTEYVFSEKKFSQHYKSETISS